MKRWIFYLKFSTPVRFGKDNRHTGLEETAFTCHSDTFFSAFFTECLQIFGEKSNFMDFLLKSIHENHFLLSDLLPYKGKELYLPKPLILPKDEGAPLENMKEIKKCRYLSLSRFQEYFRSFEIDETPVSFGQETVTTRVSRRRNEDSLPYTVAAYRFAENAGLYGIVQMPERLKKHFLVTLQSLGKAGIGGKKSSGYGKFEVYRWRLLEIPPEDKEAEYTKAEKSLATLFGTESQWYMNLSLISPTTEEVKRLKALDSWYQLLYRSGFTMDTGLKQKQALFINTGACLKEKLEGQLLRIEQEGDHPVYRYGKGIYIGVPQ